MTVKGSLLPTPLLFPGADVVASVAAGKVSWLPARAHSFTAFPISREISGVDGSYAIAGTQWREPSGLFTQLPLSPSWAPATVQPDDVELEQRLLSYKEQVSVVDEATL